MNKTAVCPWCGETDVVSDEKVYTCMVCLRRYRWVSYMYGGALKWAAKMIAYAVID